MRTGAAGFWLCDLPQYKKGETLFGLHLALPHIREQKSVILCEGYMDVMAWHQAGIPNAVAPLGTAFTPEQAKLVHAFASTALLCFDTDAAGRKATYAAMLLCRETGMDVKVLDVRGAGFPDCKDPADILKNHGPEALKKVLETGILDIDYLILNAGAQFDLGTPEGKTKACGYLFPYLAAIDSDVRLESVVARAAAAFGISSQALFSDFQKRKQPSRARAEPVTEGKKPSARKPGAEHLRNLLCLFTIICFRIPDEAFRAHTDCFPQRIQLRFDAVLEHCKDEELRSVMTDAYTSGEFSTRAEEIVDDSIRRIQRNVLEKQKAGLIAKIKLAPVSGNSRGETDVDEMIARIREIDGKLKDLKEA